MERCNRPKKRRSRPRLYLFVGALLALAVPAIAQFQGMPYGYKAILAKSGVINTGASYLHGCLGYNNGASTAFIQFFDSLTVPAEGTAPGMTPLQVAAASPFAWDAGAGGSRVFNTGLSWAASSTVATKTIIAGNDIIISCQFN